MEGRPCLARFSFREKAEFRKRRLGSCGSTSTQFAAAHALCSEILAIVERITFVACIYLCWEYIVYAGLVEVHRATHAFAHGARYSRSARPIFRRAVSRVKGMRMSLAL